MSNLISREAALDAIDAKCKKYFNSMGIFDYDYDKADEQSKWISDGVGMAVDAILDLPAIEPVKRGRWVHDGQQHRCGVDWMHCSECGYRDAIEAKSMYHYCPNCGADMRGEEDDSD